MCGEECTCKDEAQRLQREATKSRSGGPLGPVVDQTDESPQPGTEDVPDA